MKKKSIFTRSKNNPILKPNPDREWDSFKVYNPGAVFSETDGKIHLFYRGMNRGENWRSTIGHAISDDGEAFVSLDTPALRPETAAELRGLEDPRVTLIEDTYYMAYGAYDGNDVRLSIATSKDLYDWQKRGPAFKDFKFLKYGGHRRVRLKEKSINYDDDSLEGKERSKSGGIFPEKINGKYWMIFGEFTMWLAMSDDAIHWNVLKKPFLTGRHDSVLDCAFVEMGPPPIKTDKGWLVFYHGIDERKTYRLGFLLLDLNDPREILFRSNEPIFWPEAPYEMRGIIDVLPGGLNKLQKMNNHELEEFLDENVRKKLMPAVTFCCGAVIRDDEIRIYYGAGDSYICSAAGSIKEILKLIR
ncbi:MAG: hypothetical protein WCT19_00535 [Candidatus Paceibacterota bacterium]|jgi:predicted GH43/DUF377 family glycosyl hydrolase